MLRQLRDKLLGNSAFKDAMKRMGLSDFGGGEWRLEAPRFDIQLETDVIDIRCWGDGGAPKNGYGDKHAIIWNVADDGSVEVDTQGKAYAGSTAICESMRAVMAPAATSGAFSALICPGDVSFVTTPVDTSRDPDAAAGEIVERARALASVAKSARDVFVSAPPAP